MSKFSGINRFRRKIMRLLFRNMGQSISQPKTTGDVDFERILISRPNGRLGNLLLITPLIEEVSQTFPQCKIDLFVKGGLGPIIFKNYKNVDRIIQLPGKPFDHLPKYIKVWFGLRTRSYDLVINVISESSSGRLSTKFSRAPYKLFGEVPADIKSKHEDYRHLAKIPVYAFRHYVNTLGINSRRHSVSSLDLRLSKEEIKGGKALMDKLTRNDNSTICLFTYATGEKCYSKTFWFEIYGELQKAFPNHDIIEVLPKENVSQLSFEASTFYSRDIREIGALIHHSAIFISGDCGMMHLASAVNAPTLGLFCITDLLSYAPYNEQSVALDTNHCKIDDYLDAVKSILNKTEPELNFEGLLNKQESEAQSIG